MIAEYVGQAFVTELDGDETEVRASLGIEPSRLDRTADRDLGRDVAR